MSADDNYATAADCAGTSQQIFYVIEQDNAIEITNLQNEQTEDSYEAAAIEELIEVDMGVLCRLCATQNEYLIPIFEGEGLQNELGSKINNHLPIQVFPDDALPHLVCYQCASQVISWHDLRECAVKADQQLRELHKAVAAQDAASGRMEGASFEIKDSGILKNEKPEADNNIMKDGCNNIQNDSLHENYKKVHGPENEVKPEDASTLDRCVNAGKLQMEDSSSETDEVQNGGTTIDQSEPSAEDEEEQVFDSLTELIGSDNIIGDENVLFFCEPCNVLGDERFSKSHLQCCVNKNIKLEMIDGYENAAIDANKETFVREFFAAQETNSNANNGERKLIFDISENIEEMSDCVEGADDGTVDCESQIAMSVIISEDVNKKVSRSGSDMAVIGTDSVERCPYCPKVFKSQQKAELHVQTHLASEVKMKFTCFVCHEQYNSVLDLRIHKTTHQHSETGRWHCSFCVVQCGTEKTLRLHMNEHANKLYACELCERKFKRKSNLEAHMSNHVRDFACAVCCYSFPSQFSLDRHIAHHEQAEREDSRTKINIVECPFNKCSEVFHSKYALWKHKNVHLNLREFKCDVCLKTFKNEAILCRHKNIHAKNYECSVCRKKFANQKTLNEHVRIHTGELPFECKICYQKFRCQSNLTIHKSTHTGEKNYKCGQCKYSFRKPNYLKEHLRTHNNSRPYVCKYCGKGYAQSNVLTKHILTMHRRCPLCEDIVGTKLQLQVHMWKKHPKEENHDGSELFVTTDNDQLFINEETVIGF